MLSQVLTQHIVSSLAPVVDLSSPTHSDVEHVSVSSVVILPQDV
jgi:hypothetical protein